MLPPSSLCGDVMCLGYQRFGGPCCPHLHCVVTSYSVVVGYQRFGGPNCLHLHWFVTQCSVMYGRLAAFRRTILTPSSVVCDAVYSCVLRQLLQA
jgi:hypothetical protein